MIYFKNRTIFKNRLSCLKSTISLFPLILVACGSSNTTNPSEANKFIEGSSGNDLIGPFESPLWFKSNGGNDHILGSPKDDMIHLESGRNKVETYGGDDKIYLNSWGSQLDAGIGDDILYIELHTSYDIVIDTQSEIIYRENLLSSFNNEIKAFESVDAGESSSNFNIISTDGIHTIKTGTGDDAVLVSNYTVDLDGGEGSDTLIFESSGFNEVQIINLGDGIYQSQSGREAGTLVNFENVEIVGNNETTLIGDQNENRLSGGNGIDRIIGNGGSDVLNGGGGRDYFVFKSGLGSSSADRILDFNAGNGGDVLQLDYDGALTSTGFSFRSIDLSSGGKKTLGNNTDILLLRGEKYLSEEQVLENLNGLNGLEEQYSQFQKSVQICLWESQLSDGLNVSIISDTKIDALFANDIFTIAHLSDLGQINYSEFSATNFEIL